MLDPRTHRRRIIALVACALWVLGFEIAPSIHIGFHELFGHHEHKGDSERHHHHDDGDGDDSPQHGDGSLEHRGLAILDAPPPPAVVPVVPIARVPLIEHVSSRVSNAPPHSLRARGPPLDLQRIA